MRERKKAFRACIICGYGISAHYLPTKKSNGITRNHKFVARSTDEIETSIRADERRKCSLLEKATAKTEEEIIANYEKRKAQQEEIDRIEDAKARRR
jgi:uncharacterized protein YhaN